MFKNTYQSGLLSIFYSCGSNPLAIWDSEVHNGHIKRITDKEVNSIVLEIVSTNVATTYISCPRSNQVLGIRLPFLVMVVKNLKRYFSFEITILDDKNMRRRFRISNFQSTTKIRPFCTTMPIGLSGGWNQIQFNLADFTRRAYGTQFIESLRVQVHANVRLRRIYFADRLYTEEELPQDYKLYLPLDRKMKKKGEEKPAPPGAAPPAGVPAEGVPPEGVPPVEGAPPVEGVPPTAVPSKTEGVVKAEEAPPAEAAAAPAEGGAAPAEGEAAPAEGEAAPAAEGEAPAEGEAAPAEGEAAPAAEGEAAPAEGEAAPAEGEAAPAEGEAPPAEGAAPPAEGEAPPPEGEAPAEAPAEEAPPAEAEAPAEPAPEEAPAEPAEEG